MTWLTTQFPEEGQQITTTTLSKEEELIVLVESLREENDELQGVIGCMTTCFIISFLIITATG